MHLPSGIVLLRVAKHPIQHPTASQLLWCRPVHYNVLLDQNRFQPDELQAFIYTSCYQFARCTRSVSMCPPGAHCSIGSLCPVDLHNV